MHVGVPPHTPPHAPVPQAPCCLGGMVATTSAFILIFCTGHMPSGRTGISFYPSPVAYNVCSHDATSHGCCPWPDAWIHTWGLPSVTMHRGCIGFNCWHSCGHMPIWDPTICQAYAKRHKFPHHRCGWWVAVGRAPAWIPGDVTRGHLHYAYGGLSRCAWVGVSATPKCHHMPEVAKISKCSQSSINHPLRVLVRPLDRGGRGHTHTECAPTGTHSTKTRAETPYMPRASNHDFWIQILCPAYARAYAGHIQLFLPCRCGGSVGLCVPTRNKRWMMHPSPACVLPRFHRLSPTPCLVLTGHG